MKRAVAVVCTAVLASAAVVCVHLWSTSTDTGAPRDRPATSHPARSPRTGGLSDGAVARASGSLHIRGRVVGPAGPMAGVVVAAFAPYDGDADPLARALCADSETHAPIGGCEGGDRASAAVAESFASRELERPALSRATTDAEGRFSLEGLAAGSYDLWAERQGGFAGSPAVEAPAEDLELALEAGVMVAGKVDVNGAAPAEALLVSGSAMGFPRIFEAQTGAGGEFALGPLPFSERTVVSTSLDGYLGAHEVVAASGDERGGATGVVLQLFLARRIAGVVLDDGRPAAGVTVSLEGEAPAMPDAVTDVAGRFAFEGVHPGEFTVRGARRFAVGTEQVSVPGDRDPRPVTVELESVGMVRGVLRDGTGRPVAKGTVFLAGHETVETGADGRFELTEADAMERLIARAEGFLPVDEELKVPSGEVLERDITLTQAVVLKGTVVDEAGQPVHLATLTIRDASSSEGSQAVSQQDGEFEMESDRATVEVDVESVEYVSVRRTISAGARERIVLRKGGSLLVRLVDSDGRPVTDGAVTATPLRGSADRRTLVGRRNGPAHELILFGLTAGEYRVEARTDSAIEVRVVRSDGRGRQTLEMKLPALGQITGTVVTSKGAPVAEAYVRAHGMVEGGRRNTTSGVRTDERGQFQLPVGRGSQYELFAFKDNRMPVSGIAAVVDGAPVKIVLQEPAKVQGRILYPDGTPASVFSVNGERIRSPDGHFEQEVTPGELQLSLGAPGFAPQIKSFTVRDGEELDLGDIPLAEGRTVAVRVVDARTGAPVRGALVHVAGVNFTGNADEASSVDEPARRTRTDGTTSLSQVPDRAVLSVEADGYRSALVEVGLGSSEVVRLEPNGTLRVVLDDRFEGPLWAAVEGPEDRVLPLDPTSGAAFPSLPAGDYVVTLWTVPPPAGKGWSGTMAPVQPREISFPSEGSEEVHFRLRSTGANVTVQVAGVAPDWDTQMMLLKPGTDPKMLTSNLLSLRLEQVLVPEILKTRGPARFARVPEGAYQVALMLFGPVGHGVYIAPQPVTVQGSEARMVQITLPDDWRPEPE